MEGRSNKLGETSAQYYGGHDKTSHHISGQDPVQDVDLDENDQEIAKVINAERSR